MHIAYFTSTDIKHNAKQCQVTAQGNAKKQNKDLQPSHYQHRLIENPLPPFQLDLQKSRMNLQIKIELKCHL